MRVKTSLIQLQISEEAAYKWDPHALDHPQMAALVYKLFGKMTTTDTPVQINNAIGNFNFGWKLNDREIEEESYANLCKLITDHYGPIETVAADTQLRIAQMIYKKLPAHSEMSKLYSDKTKLDTADNGSDNITRALDRYLSVIQTVRNLTEKALAFRIPNDEFYSGPTVEKQAKKVLQIELYLMEKKRRDVEKSNHFLRSRTQTGAKVHALRTNLKLAAESITHVTHAAYMDIPMRTTPVQNGTSPKWAKSGPAKASPYGL
jgi:hypothetical protein